MNNFEKENFEKWLQFNPSNFLDSRVCQGEKLLPNILLEAGLDENIANNTFLLYRLKPIFIEMMDYSIQEKIKRGRPLNDAEILICSDTFKSSDNVIIDPDGKKIEYRASKNDNDFKNISCKINKDDEIDIEIKHQNENCKSKTNYIFLNGVLMDKTKKTIKKDSVCSYYLSRNEEMPFAIDFAIREFYEKSKTHKVCNRCYCLKNTESSMLSLENAEMFDIYTYKKKYDVIKYYKENKEKILELMSNLNGMVDKYGNKGENVLEMALKSKIMGQDLKKYLDKNNKSK